MSNSNAPTGSDSSGRERSVGWVYATSLGLLGLVMLVSVVRVWQRPLPVASTASRSVAPNAWGIDPNRAEWYDLARLPGIGRAKAESIIAFREKAATSDRSLGLAGSRPFTTADDLQAVSGIGPKTVARIRPYLRFEPDGSSLQRKATPPNRLGTSWPAYDA